MRINWKLACLSLVISASCVSLTRGDGWFKKTWRGIVRDTQRNNAWPEPFIPDDRASVRGTFATQVQNGWRTQNTLGDHHFDEDTGKLNEAGLRKMQTILLESPLEFRTVFVVKSNNPEQTAARVASIYEAGSRLVPPGTNPEVLGTDSAPRTTPSYYVDAVDRAFRASTPVPRITSGVGGMGMSGGGAPGAGS